MGPSFLISTGLFRNFLFSHTKISFFHCAIQLPEREIGIERKLNGGIKVEVEQSVPTT